MAVSYEYMDDSNLDMIITLYIDYYNTVEKGCWTYEKAFKRIHQILTMEDSLCLIQKADGNISGFALGFYKVFDDLTGFYLEEIVILKNYQGKGFGTLLMKKIEETVKENHVDLIELLSIKDDMHTHFYGKNGFQDAENVIFKCKHIS